MAVTRRQPTRPEDDGTTGAAAAAAAAAATTSSPGRRRASAAAANAASAPSTSAGGSGLLRKAVLTLLAAAALVGGAAWYYIVPHAKRLDLRRGVLTPERLRSHCEDHIGPPRVEEVTAGVFVAIGYDLANTILIQTAEGHVVVDVAMNPTSATRIRAALEERAGKAPIHSIVYTHSHVDHVGGAEVWAENGTRIWGTEDLTAHFFKQYGQFRQAEALRGARQFGSAVPLSELPCSGLGAKPDVDLTVRTMAFLIPTDTFRGKASFTAGGLTFELVEAHGETHDQLFVYIPEKKTLLPGDNYYESFPNLYTVRGTSPRPIRQWIKSLDEMRKLDPEFLVPSHTRPLAGREVIQQKLRDYRDGIQWVYVSTVRGANDGRSVDELAETIALPPHLRAQSALDELYGQIDWSVRAIYGNELGWFDGRAEELYKLPHTESASRLVQLLGGAARVLSLAAASVEAGERPGQEQEHQWALYLLKLLQEAGADDPKRGGTPPLPRDAVKSLQVRALRGLAGSVMNTNGRGYLLQVAQELEGGVHLSDSVLGQAFIEAIPIALIFEVMLTRLVPERARDVVQTALYAIGEHKFWVTIRYGLVEIVEADEPLPGTPEPIGAFTTSEAVFRQIALGMMSPAKAVAAGVATIDGDLAKFVTMSLMFEKGA